MFVGLTAASGFSGIRHASEPRKVRPEVSTVLQAQTEVSVIVSLREPPALRAPTLDIGILEAQVAESQQRVLSALAAGEFSTTYRYRAVPALAGIATTTAIDKLAAHPEVIAVSLNREVHATLSQSVPQINADAVHALGITGAGIEVAILDSGIDTDHPDLADDLLSENCFLFDSTCIGGETTCSGPGCAEDEHGHGSRVSGIITSGGIVASVGVAPDAKIRAYKILNAAGSGRLSSVLAALDHIITNYPGTKLVNMSLSDGLNHPPGSCDGILPSVTVAIDTLRTGGTSIFAASGNDAYKDGMSYPACISSVISVGAVYDAGFGSVIWTDCTDATTALNQVVCSSNADASLDLLAPGCLITTTALGGGTSSSCGTSFAAPHSVGVAALMLDNNLTLTPDEIEACLEVSGMPISDAANGITTPRVDALAALTCVAPTPTPCLPTGCPTPTPTATNTPTPVSKPNDPFASAVVIPGVPYVNSQFTTGFTVEAGEPQPCAGIGSTAWYSFTPTSTGLLTADTLGSNYDTALAVYTGATLGTLVNVGCDDDGLPGFLSQLSFNATAGVTYHFQVGGFAGDSGTLFFNLTPPPPPPTPTSTPTVSISTDTPTPTATPTNTPTKTPTPTPTLTDKDRDGCSNAQELQPKSAAGTGGGRDPNYIWDVFDTETENGLNAGTALGGTVNVGDIFAVAGHFGDTGDPGIDLLSDASGAGYHTRFDRGDQTGPNSWNRAPADGSVTIGDIFAIAAQFGLNC